METRVTHNGITINLEMNQVPKQLKDGTWAHPVRIMSQASINDLPKLIGLELWGEPVLAYLPENGKFKQTYETVGLVLKNKKWSGK